MMSFLSRFRRKPNHSVSPFYDIGFHGDLYLLSLVDSMMKVIEAFVETGTNVGSTLAYVARSYPHVHCFSCEPREEAFESAKENTRLLSNVSIYNETSMKLLRRLETDHPHLFEGQATMFWLDAHGEGFKWPLKEEISFITKICQAAYILIDDFKVPDLDCFGYDEYQGQECSFDYIKGDLNTEREYRLYYPNYKERTSEHHPLQGWGLIEFGHDRELEFSDPLVDKIRRVSIGNLRHESCDKI